MKYISTLFSFLFLVSCNDIQYPEYIGTKNTKIEKLGIGESTLRTDLEYKNPNNFGVEIKDADMKVYIEGKYIGDAEQPQPLKIAAKSNFLFPITVKFNASNVLAQSVSMLFKKEINYRVSGTARVGKGKVFIKVPINFEDKFIIRE